MIADSVNNNSNYNNINNSNVIVITVTITNTTTTTILLLLLLLLLLFEYWFSVLLGANAVIQGNWHMFMDYGCLTVSARTYSWCSRLWCMSARDLWWIILSSGWWIFALCTIHVWHHWLLVTWFILAWSVSVYAGLHVQCGFIHVSFWIRRCSEIKCRLSYIFKIMEPHGDIVPVLCASAEQAVHIIVIIIIITVILLLLLLLLLYSSDSCIWCLLL
jgi:hypothetical protein